MSCFDLHYYQLNRRLLKILGQWPYQRYYERAIVMIVYASVMISGVYFQVLRELYVDEDLWVEHVTEGLSTLVILVRYYTYAIYHKRIKQLLNEMNEHWECLININDHKVFYPSLTEATNYVHNYLLLCLPFLTLLSVCLLLTPALKYVPFVNDSCIILTMYPSGDIFDPETQCYVVIVYMVIVIGLLALGVLATDSMYVVILLHSITLFRVASYRVEHAYDDCFYDEKYTSGRSSVYEKMISAVNCHRTAIRFAEELGDIYSIPNTISVGINMIYIAISLYWAAISQEENFKMMLSLVASVVFMVHLAFMDYPSQKLVDNSEAIAFKAYSALWYKAPAKEQMLVLMAMQRGLKPTAILIGKTHRATLENFAAEIQASFSYFTLLLSIQ